MRRCIAVCVLLSFWLLSCSGGGSSSSGGRSNIETLNSLSISTPYYLPNDSSVKTEGYIYLYNNSNVSITNLSYAVANNNTDSTITLESNQCSSIAPYSSCSLHLSFLRTSDTGSFNIQVSNGTQTLNSNIIGLSNVPITNYTGADGISLISYPYIITNSIGLETKVLVEALVNSPDIGVDFNTIKLTDANGTPLDYVVLSNNNGIESLTQGHMITFGLSLPTSIATMPIYVQIGNTINNVYTAIDTSSGFITVSQSSSAGILNLIPQNAILSKTHESQIFTIYNEGNQTVSSFSLTLPYVEGLSLINNSCTGNLDAQASCSYTIVFEPNSVIGTYNSILDLSLSDGLTDNSISQITYTGVGPYGVSASLEKSHFSTMIGQVESSLLIIKNTGTVDESGIRLSVSGSASGLFNFSQSSRSDACSLSGSIVGTILSGDSCTVVVSYLSNQVESDQSAYISAIYYYSGSKILKSITKLDYTTVDDYPIIQVSPRYVNYPQLAANNIESYAQKFIVNNYGYESTTDLAVSFLNNESGDIFSIINNTCGQILAPSESCSFNVLANPTTISGSYFSSVNVSYAGKSEIESLAVDFYNPESSNIKLLVIPSYKFGGFGVESSPFTLKYGESANIVLSYINSGTESIIKFNVSVPSSVTNGYTEVVNNCNNIDLPPNNLCEIKFIAFNNKAGSYNINLNKILYSGQNESQTVSNWQGNSEVFVSFLPKIPVGLNSFSIVYDGISYAGTFESLEDRSIMVTLPQNSFQYTAQESAIFIAKFSPASSQNVVKVESIVQASGINSHDFWKKITYSVTQTGEQSVDYVVYVFSWNIISGTPWSSYGATAIATDESGNIFVGDSNADLYVYSAESQQWNTIQSDLSSDELGITTIAPINVTSAFVGTAASMFGGHEYYVDSSSVNTLNTFHELGKFPFSSFYSSDLPVNLMPLYGDSLGNLWAYNNSDASYDSPYNSQVSSVIYSNGNIWFAIAFNGSDSDEGYIYYCTTSFVCNQADSGSNTYVTADESGSAYAAWGQNKQGSIVLYNYYDGNFPSVTIYQPYNPCNSYPSCTPQIIYNKKNKLLYYLYYTSSGFSTPNTAFGVVSTNGITPTDLPLPPVTGRVSYSMALDNFYNNVIFLSNNGPVYWMHYPN